MARNRILFSTPLLAAGVVLALVIGLVVGKALGGGGAQGNAGPGKASGLRIDVIVKATDSSFWQSMFAGAQRAGEDLGVDVGRFGPTSETDVSDQVRLVENSISRGVDAIVLAANSESALNKVIDRARQSGIKVVTVDGTVSTQNEAFIGTNNLRAGEQAGQRLCQLVTAQGKTSGRVLLENAVAGVQALGDRAKGFRQGLAASCPQLTVWQERFNNNDINTAANQTNDALGAVPDLVGIFAANNMSGNGVARAIKDTGRAATLPVVAFDSDPQENAALADGSIDTLVVQNPYFFGYQGVVEAIAASTGAKVPLSLDPGAVLADQGNMNDPAVKDLLNPPTAQASQ
ncbi:ABC transporter substrate-binding protein [Amycolatopsis sacchari]|uniref:Ribose transport system substrate-binding protein n=1 Tax=Amycolatopsis sacchari TaxID=115433 RepID=A0A1I3J952_9PSEU|nr:ABC transporter substrate-binding protein [Amycolatopsis sacchari]SFI56425.1 ribose transport system substrate-binding protein [Amycolatopsis sacchari]